MGEVINLNSRRKTDKDRQPLYMTHGKIKAGKDLSTMDDFPDRMMRIKESLVKIQMLLDALRNQEKEVK